MTRPAPYFFGRLMLTAALLALLPSLALANAGTPLMWARLFHLVAANFIIGAVEGAVLAYLLGLRMRPSLIVMVIANYVSAMCGPILYSAVAARIGETNIYNVSEHLTLSYVASYVATLVVEFPFALAVLHFAAKPDSVSLRFDLADLLSGLSLLLPASRRMLLVLMAAFLLSQTITYAALTYLYMNASATSLAFANSKDPSLAFLKPFEGNLYYLDAKDDRLYRMDLADRTRVQPVGNKAYAEAVYDRLFVHRGSKDQPWTLAVGRGRGIEDVRPLPGEALAAANYSRMDYEPLDVVPKSELVDQYREIGGVAVVPGASLRGRRMITGDWAALGLHVWQGEAWQSPSKRYALEVPVATWPIRNATLLPDDIVIFQLGDDQIVALDLKTDTIGLIARGRGPLVTQRMAPPAPSTTDNVAPAS